MIECRHCKAKSFLAGEPLSTVPCTKCGHLLLVPMQMRQFELRSVIASGGRGTVYRAFDIPLQREVALKMMKREMAQDPDVMEGFYREARASAALNHPNIIHIYSFDDFEGQPFLVMELADNGSLDGMIERDGRVSELTVLDVGFKISEALYCALRKNLLHRDIKPANILFNEDSPPEPKLVDFGLARKAETEEHMESTIWGTPYYVAPEKIRRTGEDFRSDMYSLGGTLYHAITGRVPFEAPTIDELVQAHVYQPLVPPNQIVPEISQLTSDAIVRSMAKDPNERYTDYNEFRLALEMARGHLLRERYAGEAA